MTTQTQYAKGEFVIVDQLPTCDFFGRGATASYDFNTRIRDNGGPWANACEQHFAARDGQLGTGKGQRLLLETE